MTQSPVLNGENNTGRVPFTIFNDLYIFRSLSLAHSLLPPIESFSRYFPDIIRRVSFFFSLLVERRMDLNIHGLLFPSINLFFSSSFLIHRRRLSVPAFKSLVHSSSFFFFLIFYFSFYTIHGRFRGNLSLSLLLPFKLFFFFLGRIIYPHV